MPKVTAEVLYEEILNDALGMYAWLNPDEKSTLAILRMLRGAPFKTYDSTELHVTCVYCKNSLPGTLSVPEDTRYGAKIVGVDSWQDHKNRTILVLRLDSEDLQALHANLTEQGLEHSFDEYMPHITVAKDVQLNAATRLWLDDANAHLRWRPLEIAFSPELRAAPVS